MRVKNRRIRPRKRRSKKRHARRRSTSKYKRVRIKPSLRLMKTLVMGMTRRTMIKKNLKKKKKEKVKMIRLNLPKRMMMMFQLNL